MTDVDDRELRAQAERLVERGDAVAFLKRLGTDALRGLRDSAVSAVKQRLGLAPKPRPAEPSR